MREIVALSEFEFTLGKTIIVLRVFVGCDDPLPCGTMVRLVGRGDRQHMGTTGGDGGGSWLNASLFSPSIPASFVFVLGVRIFVFSSCCILDTNLLVAMWLHTLLLASLPSSLPDLG